MKSIKYNDNNINNIKNKKRIFQILKYILLFLFLFTIYFIVCAKSYAKSVSSDISSSVFRLHVIASSDSEEDQDLKLKVRDEILSFTNTLITPDMDKNSLITVLKENEDALYQIAYNTIKQQGFNYDVSLSFGNFYFPTKSYGDISLPARIL